MHAGLLVPSNPPWGEQARGNTRGQLWLLMNVSPSSSASTLCFLHTEPQETPWEGRERWKCPFPGKPHSKLSANCIRCFSSHFDKIPDASNFRKKGLLWFTGRGLLHHVGENMASTVRKQRKMNYRPQLPLFLCSHHLG